MTGMLEHPNIVPVHFVELGSDGAPLVVMKRVAGTEWNKLIDRADEVKRRFGTTDLLTWNLDILMSVLDALRFAHHRGVIHRDVKPSNVMIGDFGEVYLLDWGIAVSLRDDPSGRLPTLSSRPELAGTPAYLAPEMRGRPGSPRQSERTDVYLAGAVLYEIVTGAPPHRGDDSSTMEANATSTSPWSCPRTSRPSSHESACGRWPRIPPTVSNRPTPRCADRAEGLPSAPRGDRARGARRSPARRAGSDPGTPPRGARRGLSCVRRVPLRLPRGARAAAR